MASFWYSFCMLLKRDWTIFWRDKMKFGTNLLNSLMKFLLAGLLFINAIPPREEIALNPLASFIGIQGFAFNCTTATVMPSINVVALASNWWVIKFRSRDSFTIRRQILRSTIPFLIFYRSWSSCSLEFRPAQSYSASLPTGSQDGPSSFLTGFSSVLLSLSSFDCHVAHCHWISFRLLLLNSVQSSREGGCPVEHSFDSNDGAEWSFQ